MHKCKIGANEFEMFKCRKVRNRKKIQFEDK